MNSGKTRSVVFMMYGHDPMQQRWSLDYLSEGLMSLGINTMVVNSDNKDVERICGVADVVVVYKCFHPEVIGMMRRLKSRGVVVVFCCDDYLFQPGCKYTGGGLTLEPLDVADVLMSPSSFLLSKMPFDKPKILRRNVLDKVGMETLRQNYRRSKGVFSVGFTMLPSRSAEMEGFMNLILGELNAGIRVGEKLACNFFGKKRFGGHNKIDVRELGAFERGDWKRFYEKLVSLDLGVVANPMDEGNDYWHAKSELKFVESGAMGVPLVTVRVPPYTEFLKEGENGFFASTPREFADKILLIMRDEALSRKVSLNAYRNVVDDYDVTKNAAGFLEDLDNARKQLVDRVKPSVDLSEKVEEAKVEEVKVRCEGNGRIMKPSVDLRGQKICMVMGYTVSNPKFAEMGKFVSEVNMAYCFKHGYGFRLYTSGFAEDRHPSWSKILFVQDTLKSYPWVMWVDADAIVTNSEVGLEQFLDDKYMLIVGKQNWTDQVWNSINFGVFLIRNDPDVDGFFKRVWDDITRPGRTGWEQDGVRRVMEDEPFKSKIKVVCRRGFNSLVPHKSLGLADGFNHDTESWHKGDFIAHYGWRRDDTVEAMKVLLGKSIGGMPGPVVSRDKRTYIMTNLAEKDNQVVQHITHGSFLVQSVMIPNQCVLNGIEVVGATYSRVLTKNALFEINIDGKRVRDGHIICSEMVDNQCWSLRFDPIGIQGKSVMTVRITNKDSRPITFYQCSHEYLAKAKIGVKQSRPIAMILEGEES